MNNLSHPNQLRTAKILLAAAILVSLGLGIYHTTHHGVTSGPIELAFAALLIWIEVGLFQAVFGIRPGQKSTKTRTIGLAALMLMTTVVFILAIYHYTHNGPLSGTLELALTIWLGTAILLVRKT